VTKFVVELNLKYVYTIVDHMNVRTVLKFRRRHHSIHV